MARKFSASYFPVTVEHDPRITPIGRTSSAELRKRDDGEHELVVTAEIFEEDDGDYAANGKCFNLPNSDRTGLVIEFDRSFCNPEDRQDVLAIGDLLGSKPVEQCKKALDPISILQISGKFALIAIAAGFFGQIGADGWTFLKKRLSELFERKRKLKRDYLFVFDALVAVDSSRRVNVQIIFTNPTGSTFDREYADSLANLDLVLPVYVERLPEMRKFVFEAKEGEIDLKFALRADCLPFRPEKPTRELLAQIRQQASSRPHSNHSARRPKKRKDTQ
jgi:hypothetical protein